MQILLFFILFVVSTSANSQATKVSVTIIDNMGSPIPNATVSLLNATTKAVIKNKIADTTGSCIFQQVPAGIYFLIASTTGYIISTTPVFTVHDTVPVINLGSLVTARRVTELAGVTVRATQSLIKADDDKISYDVAKDPSLAGLSAAEALSKVPFVSVDGNGNVQLKGQSSFQILLNGKPTSMFATNPGEVLKSFPANIISKIEVITNPSAKYEGEGLTGLINIITKNKVAGYSGAVNLNYNTIGQINPNASFNLKYGKLGITSFGYYARNTGFNTHGSQEYTALNPSPAFAFRHSADESRRSGYQLGGNLELAYDIDSLQAISLYGRLLNGGNEVRQRNHISAYNTAGVLLQESLFETREDADFPGGEIGLDYLKKYRKPGKSFSFNINREMRSTKSLVNSNQDNLVVQDRFLVNRSVAKNIQTGLQSDFAVPLSKRSKLEAGIRIILRNVNSEYRGNVKDLQTGEYVPDPQNSDKLKYTQNVYGLYSVYTFSWKEKGLTLKAGGRIERTVVDGNFISKNTKVKQDYYSFLPSLSINKTLTGNKRFTLAYNRRLSRPGLSFLNPFTDNRDPFFISRGNESLEPEFANNIEASFSSFKNKISYSISFNGSFTTGNIQRYFVFDDATGITVQTYGNTGRSSVYGIGGFLSLKPAEKLSVSINANYNYIRVKNTATQGEKNSGIYGTVNSSVDYQATDRLNIFNNITYTLSPVQLQGRNGDYLFYNIGAGYWLSPKKFMAYIGFINPFDKNWKAKSQFESDGFRQQTTTYRPMQALAIGMRFNFGKLKESTSKKKGITVDDGKEQ